MKAQLNTSNGIVLIYLESAAVIHSGTIMKLMLTNSNRFEKRDSSVELDIFIIYFFIDPTMLSHNKHVSELFREKFMMQYRLSGFSCIGTIKSASNIPKSI